MTPRELDPDAAHAKLRLMRELLDDLENLQEVTPEQLKRERLHRYAVERILTRLVDLAVSVNSHIAGSLLGRAPASYRESFELAARAGAIDVGLAAELSRSVGLRNVLTHEYVAVDLDTVARSVPLALAGYRRYLRAVARFLTA
ncbi:MAG: type VII toxin-antitoxin system HepT family RNase toxin [Carbonactinosporaceae bacterium]